MCSEAASVLSVRGLRHQFGAGASARPVLQGIDLEVSPGEMLLLMGPSGCGKTTLLTLVGALRSVQSGDVVFMGRSLAQAKEADLRAARRRIGFIFQSHNLHRSLTAIRNVRMALEAQGDGDLKDWRARCAAALDSVGLGDRLEDYPAQLSGGQKQRVAIARALVARPPLILADEATAALDRQSGRDVVELLRARARAQGAAVLMVTHDNRILDVADRILEMEDGRLIAAAAPAPGPEWRRASSA